MLSVTITNDMTLDEKLAAIDAALLNAEAIESLSDTDAPVDPASLVMCESCQ